MWRFGEHLAFGQLSFEEDLMTAASLASAASIVHRQTVHRYRSGDPVGDWRRFGNCKIMAGTKENAELQEG